MNNLPETDFVFQKVASLKYVLIIERTVSDFLHTALIMERINVRS